MDRFEQVFGAHRGRAWTDSHVQALHQASLVPYWPKALDLLSQAPKGADRSQAISMLISWLTRVGFASYQRENFAVLQEVRLFHAKCKNVLIDFSGNLHVVVDDELVTTALCGQAIENSSSVARGSYTDPKHSRCEKCYQCSKSYDIAELAEDYMLTGMSKVGERAWQQLAYPILVDALEEGASYGDSERVITKARAAFGMTRPQALKEDLLVRKDELEVLIMSEKRFDYIRNIESGRWDSNRLWSDWQLQKTADILLPSQEQPILYENKDIAIRVARARSQATVAIRLRAIRHEDK